MQTTVQTTASTLPKTIPSHVIERLEHEWRQVRTTEPKPQAVPQR